MGSQQLFCLRWSNHQSNMLSVFDELLQHEALVDVTIACEGLSLKAHKVVLSACSPYFQHLFLENPCKHPIVILKDIKYNELKALVDFMYKGEVNVTQEQLSALLKTAETLKIKGLAEVTGGSASGGVNGQQQQQQHQQDRERTPPPPLLPVPPSVTNSNERLVVPQIHSSSSSVAPLVLPPPPPSASGGVQQRTDGRLSSPSRTLAPSFHHSSQSMLFPSSSLRSPSSLPSSLSISTLVGGGVRMAPSSSSSSSSFSPSIQNRSVDPRSPPSKRKKTRHRRRSMDASGVGGGGGGGGGGHSDIEDRSECIEMQGSPEMIEAKVEMTSPDDYASESVPDLPSDHEDDHLEQPHDLQTDSNQESMDNLYSSRGPSNQSGDEYVIGGGGGGQLGEPLALIASSSSALPSVSLLPKMKSPSGPSTSSGLTSQGQGLKPVENVLRNAKLWILRPPPRLALTLARSCLFGDDVLIRSNVTARNNMTPLDRHKLEVIRNVFSGKGRGGVILLQPSEMDREKLDLLHGRSSNLRKFATNLARVVFAEDEFMTSNCNGRSGHSALDAQRW